jgi:hypothetical protein
MYNRFSYPLQLSIIISFILVLSQKIYSQALISSDSLTTVLNAKENEMFNVIINGDKKQAEKLFADDYITINADGVMEGKENTLKTIGKFKGAETKLSDKKIRVFGSIAIINGKAKFYLKQVPVAEIFYTEIWDYRAGQWQFIGWQGTLTGVPSYYPVILTSIILIIIFFVARLIFRKRTKRLKQ